MDPPAFRKEGAGSRGQHPPPGPVKEVVKLIHFRGNHTHCPVKARVGWVPGAWGRVWEKPPTQSYFSLSPDHL